MPAKVTEQLIEALHGLMTAYIAVQDLLETQGSAALSTAAVGSTSEDEAAEIEGAEEDIESLIVAEVKTAIESVMESEDYLPEDFASLLSAVTEALEEIEPSVFSDDSEDEEGDEEDDDEEYDDEDLDDEDLDDEDLDEEDLDEDAEDEEVEEEEEEAPAPRKRK
jgi:phage-related minor tail protein